MSFDRDTLRAALAAHGRIARVVIAQHRGSSPREQGASMLVWDGGQSGTIGGGALELDAARRAFAEPGVRRVPLGPSLGQCCGGAVTLVTEIFDAVPETGETFVRRIEGTAPQPLSITRAVARARNGGDNQFVFEDGWLCEPVQPARTPLWIWGAGHVGRAIVAVTAPLDQFDITWIDSAPERFPDDDTPGVTQLPVPDMPDAVRLAPPEAQHLVLTYSHAFDLEICHRLLGHGFAQAGLIGSETKWARFRSRLRTLGHSDAQISRIRCPIGQTDLGKHPQAIAIGVASELVILSQLGTSSEKSGKDVAL